MAGVELKSFSVGPMDNNVYILVDPETTESVLFDAPTDSRRILAELEGTSLRYILMTHADADHVQALQAVKEATGASIGAHPDTAPFMPVQSDFPLHDGQILKLGAHDIKVLDTPGHAPGHMGFLIGSLLIDGDTLFPGGPGNTDRPDGDFRAIIETIRTKFFVLPDDTKVLPGHGKPTTVGEERPHLQEWIDRGY